MRCRLNNNSNSNNLPGNPAKEVDGKVVMVVVVVHPLVAIAAVDGEVRVVVVIEVRKEREVMEVAVAVGLDGPERLVAVTSPHPVAILVTTTIAPITTPTITPTMVKPPVLGDNSHPEMEVVQLPVHQVEVDSLTTFHEVVITDPPRTTRARTL